MIVIAFVGGLLGAAISLALRRDTERARALRKPGSFTDDKFAFLSLPSFSLLLLGFGVIGLAGPLFGGSASSTIVAVTLMAAGALAAAVGAAGSLWGLFGSNVPQFALPKWMRRR